MAQNLRKRCVSSRRVIDALARYGRAREGILYYLLHITSDSRVLRLLTRSATLRSSTIHLCFMSTRLT